MPSLFTSIFGVLLLSAPYQSAAQNAALSIVVVEGEDAVNIIQQKTAVAPIVEVRDRNNVPVAGATVVFTIGGNGATFGGGLQTMTVVTNSAGRAIAAGLNPLSGGAMQINVAATFQGQTAVATITQTNVLTAAQAAGAAGATGTSGGAGGGGAASGSAAAGGGGISGTTIGIVGAAAAAVGGGALIAAQAASEGKRELAGNVTFEVTLVFTACTRVERYSGLVAIEFDSLDKDPLNGTATIQDGRMNVISAIGCATGPQQGQSFAWGMDPTPASGPAANITFAHTQSVAPTGPNSSGAINVIEFRGAKNGDSITGTLTYNIRIDNAQFGITTGAASANVTLVPH